MRVALLRVFASETEHPPSDMRARRVGRRFVFRERQDIAQQVRHSSGGRDALRGNVAEVRGGFDVALDVDVAKQIGLDDRELRRRQQHSAKRAGASHDERERRIGDRLVDASVPIPNREPTGGARTEEIFDDSSRPRDGVIGSFYRSPIFRRLNVFAKLRPLLRYHDRLLRRVDQLAAPSAKGQLLASSTIMKLRTGLFSASALVAATILIPPSPQAPADSSQPADGHRANPVPDTTLWIAMRDVNLHIDDQHVMQVRELHGQVMSTKPGAVPLLDDPSSFQIRVTNATVDLTGPDLAALLNEFVFAYKGAPIRDLKARVEDRRSSSAASCTKAWTCRSK